MRRAQSAAFHIATTTREFLSLYFVICAFISHSLVLNFYLSGQTVQKPNTCMCVLSWCCLTHTRALSGNQPAVKLRTCEEQMPSRYLCHVTCWQRRDLFQSKAGIMTYLILLSFPPRDRVIVIGHGIPGWVGPLTHSTSPRRGSGRKERVLAGCQPLASPASESLRPTCLEIVTGTRYCRCY